MFQLAGYKVEIMPTPDVPSFQLGKEFGSNGRCNLTYFMAKNMNGRARLRKVPVRRSSIEQD